MTPAVFHGAITSLGEPGPLCRELKRVLDCSHCVQLYVYKGRWQGKHDASYTIDEPVTIYKGVNPSTCVLKLITNGPVEACSRDFVSHQEALKSSFPLRGFVDIDFRTFERIYTWTYSCATFACRYATFHHRPIGELLLTGEKI